MCLTELGSVCIVSSMKKQTIVNKLQAIKAIALGRPVAYRLTVTQSGLSFQGGKKACVYECLFHTVGVTVGERLVKENGKF